MNRKYALAGIITVILLGSLGVVVYLSSNQTPTVVTLTELGHIDTGGVAVCVKVVGDIAYVIDSDDGNRSLLIVQNWTPE
ncbi:MAG: hypothetical protein KAU48_13075 [Candidatus Thorarchaeota archaeon]|nr:hypothetical protein [Candidatus Thorarchaeota archaeon]